MTDNILSFDIEQIILEYGLDILISSGMEYEKTQKHHGDISCFEHSVDVAYISILLMKKLHLKLDIQSLVRGSLLHDYFLYDWHNSPYKLHGFIHAKVALDNANRDFVLNNIEKDIIARHMFPLNITPPKYTESVIVSLADKLCASIELASIIFPISLPGINMEEILYEHQIKTNN